MFSIRAELRKTRNGFYTTCGKRLKYKSLVGGFEPCFPENNSNFDTTKIMFSFFFIVLLYKRIVENASDKDSFRFPEIHLDFIALARGAGHLTPKKSLGRGAFEQRKGPQGGEFDQKIQKCQMPGG